MNSEAYVPKREEHHSKSYIIACKSLCSINVDITVSPEPQAERRDSQLLSRTYGMPKRSSSFCAELIPIPGTVYLYNLRITNTFHLNSYFLLGNIFQISYRVHVHLLYKNKCDRHPTAHFRDPDRGGITKPSKTLKEKNGVW